MLVTLIFGIFVGFPIAFTLIVLAVFFGFFWLGDVGSCRQSLIRKQKKYARTFQAKTGRRNSSVS